MNKQFTKKPLNVFLKPEEVYIGKLYAISVNPVAQPQIGRCLSFKEWYDSMEHLFRDVCIASEFRLYVEISPMGRFHFHGWMCVKNIMNFYIYDVKTLTREQTCVIKEIEDPEVWEEYILKQQGLIQNYLESELYSPLVRPKAELILINTIPDFPVIRSQKTLSCKRYPEDVILKALKNKSTCKQFSEPCGCTDSYICGNHD